MFAPTPYEFGWSASNFGSTWTDAGFGVNCPGHASANTAGADTNLLNGIAEDAYGIAICFTGGATAGASRRNLVTILIDPGAGGGNAGSNWQVFIPFLFVNSAAFVGGGYWYYFPLYIPAGTAIGGRNISSTASTSALRVGVKVFGKPKRPELCRVAKGVQSMGYSAPTTIGTAVTMDYQVKGTWTYIGTINQSRTFWWQIGMAMNDSSRTINAYLLDIGWSSDGGTTVVPICENILMTDNASEQSGKAAVGDRLPFMDVPVSLDIYARCACVGGLAGEGNTYLVVYGAYD